MPLQTAVIAPGTLAYGIPGTLFDDGPRRALSYLLQGGAVPHIIGATAYTVKSEGVAQPGGTGAFCGILVDPKAYTSYGTSGGGTLAPNYTLLDNTMGELATSGRYWVTLTTAAAIGDLVVFDNTTGALSTVAAGSGSAGAGKTFVPYAVVDRFTVSAPGLAMIKL